MVTADLMNQVVEASHLDSPAARDAVEALFESVGDALERGDRVVLRRFGTSHVAARRTGVARNPRTNEPVQMPLGRVVRSRPAPSLVSVPDGS